MPQWAGVQILLLRILTAPAPSPGDLGTIALMEIARLLITWQMSQEIPPTAHGLIVQAWTHGDHGTLTARWQVLTSNKSY